MRRRSRKKETAIIDYRHRWPTQQTLYESRILDENASGSQPTSRRVKALEAQDDIDHHAELIELRKRKRFSTSTLSESPQRQRFIPTNAKPGKSTHPYDTGVGETTTVTAEDSIPPRTSSRYTERIATLKGQSARTPDHLRKVDKIKSTPSLFRDRAHGHTPQKRDDTNPSPESHDKGGFPSQRRITFRSISGLDRKNRSKISHTNPSETISTSPPQTPTGLDTPTENRRARWWKVKKQRSVHEYERDQDITSGLIEAPPVLDEDEDEIGDDLAAMVRPRCTRKNVKPRHGSKYHKGEVTKKVPSGDMRRILKNSRGGSRQQEEIHQGASKAAHYYPSSQPDRDSLKTSGPGIQRGHRKSVSSSQAHPSTTGTSSTPGTTTVHRDFAQDDWRETPSPMTPNQILRFLFGPRKTPLSGTVTQSELPEEPKISVSTSTPPLRRQSRESRTSGRPSTESKNKTWFPFRITPRPQLDASPQDSGEKSSRGGGQGEHLEPMAGEPVPSRSPNLKKPWDRILRKRWRSG
ncbi:uncharacterized protein F4807DRAFT_466488 [Annulohypoxylon truncatum]|uniref:uncharacterized protein n=1 Tax=Annulohypoxylon truncatum TaxID=327061 RepID=UPI002008238C|nr:uncharacterized protein F4807DRAFT_466488 [Annulohypoxylon truncatum]KAI1211141.1 hypothetical protein F4807DRAFT_466488 [Annulohypoxylon truncatum]